MMFLAKRVVEVRGQSGLIAFHARCDEELFTVRLQLQHEGLGVFTGPNVHVHDFERQFIHPSIVHWRVEVCKGNKRPVTILRLEVHLRFDDDAGSAGSQLQEHHVEVAVGDP